MSYVLDQTFLPEKYFEEICAVPHGSYHEKPLSDHLVRFAEAHGLKYKQYPNWNVIIYKPASPGYEDHAPVMLQAHIDMVCEKEPGYEHDFEKDPLKLYVEDGFLHAEGTTLGADDGVGVAYMMAFLDDDTLPHPPLECVFTVQEETGLIGASELAYEDLTAKRMIGLDDMGGTTCYVSACGSQHMQIARSYEVTQSALPGYKLTVKGLLGGHSGVCINKERGNAVKLSAQVMYELCHAFDVRIGSYTGGDKDNAIPVFSEVVFGCGADEEAMRGIVARMGKRFHTEFEYSDPGVTVTLERTDCPSAFSSEDSASLVDMICVLPDGFRRKSMKIEGLTTVSENLANIRTEDGKVTLRCFARSEVDSFLDQMAEEYRILSKLYGYTLELANRAPGWKFEQDSKIRETLFAAYKEINGFEMKMIAEHGGLETGYICGGIPGIDIVTCGPFCEGYHTPEERLDLASFRMIYEVLKRTLQNL